MGITGKTKGTCNGIKRLAALRSRLFPSSSLSGQDRAVTLKHFNPTE
jgi:hypothetical protein